MNTLVLAMVGTDHHRFDRLVDWVDGAAARRPDVRFLVQHGASRAPRVAEGRPFLAHDELDGLLAEASGLVCHGGPGTIMDGRRQGLVPICVPRDPLLGEHVDAHQLRFARLMDESGIVRQALGSHEFDEALDDLLTQHPGSTRSLEVDAITIMARGRLALELDRLILDPPRRRTPFRVPH